MTAEERQARIDEVQRDSEWMFSDHGQGEYTFSCRPPGWSYDYPFGGLFEGSGADSILVAILHVERKPWCSDRMLRDFVRLVNAVYGRYL